MPSFPFTWFFYSLKFRNLEHYALPLYKTTYRHFSERTIAGNTGSIEQISRSLSNIRHISGPYRTPHTTHHQHSLSLCIVPYVTGVLLSINFIRLKMASSSVASSLGLFCRVSPLVVRPWERMCRKQSECQRWNGTKYSASKVEVVRLSSWSSCNKLAQTS